MTTRITGLTISGSEIKIDYSKKEKNKPLFGWWYYQYGRVQGLGKAGTQFDNNNVYYPPTGKHCKSGLSSISYIDTYIGYLSDVKSLYKGGPVEHNTNFYLGTGIYDPSESNTTCLKATLTLNSNRITPNGNIYDTQMMCVTKGSCLNTTYGSSINISQDQHKAGNDVINFGGWGNCGNYYSTFKQCKAYTITKGYGWGTTSFSTAHRNLCINLEGGGGPMVVWDADKIKSNIPDKASMADGMTPGYVSIDIEGVYPSSNKNFDKGFSTNLVDKIGKLRSNNQKVIITLPGFGIHPANGGMAWMTKAVANATDYICLMYYSQINDTDTPGGCTDGDGNNGPLSVLQSLKGNGIIKSADRDGYIKNTFYTKASTHPDKVYDSTTFDNFTYLEGKDRISYDWSVYFKGMSDKIILGYSLSGKNETKSQNKAYFSKDIIKLANGGISIWAQKGGLYGQHTPWSNPCPITDTTHKCCGSDATWCNQSKKNCEGTGGCGGTWCDK